MFAILLGLWGCHTLDAQSPRDAGTTSIELEQALQRAGTLLWSDSPLREAMASLAVHRRVPVWLDRRCDPSRRVNLASQSSLADSLWQLSQQEDNLDVAWSADIIYVGPPNAANQWATMNQLHRQMIGRLPKPVRLIWLQKKPWSWPRLTNPQDLLEDLQRELQHPIQHGHRVTHDLWPAADFPALPLFVRLELLLAGYGYSFTIQQNGQAVLTKMPADPQYQSKQNVPTDQQASVSELVQTEPGARWSPRQRSLKASWHMHEAIARMTRTPTPPGNRNTLDANLRYTLRANDQPLEPFLMQLGKQLNLQVEFSSKAKAKVDTRISFQVEQVTVDQLFEAILGPAGLRHTRQYDRVRIDIRQP